MALYMLEQSFTCLSNNLLLNHFAFIQASFKPEQSVNLPIVHRLAKTKCSSPRQRMYLFLKSLRELTNLYSFEYKSRSTTIIVFHARGGLTGRVKIVFLVCYFHPHLFLDSFLVLRCSVIFLLYLHSPCALHQAL